MQNFLGWETSVFLGANPTNFNAAKAGMTALGTDGKSRKQGSCSGGITHVSNVAKTTATYLWTSPAKGSGLVTAWAILVTGVSRGGQEDCC